MKKTLTMLALVATAVSSQAQGWVDFANGGSDKVSTNSVVGGAATGVTFANAGNQATTYYYALFVGTVGTVAGDTGTNSFNGATGANNHYAFSDSNWTFDNPSGDGANYLGAAYGTNSVAGVFNSVVEDPNNSGNTYVHSSAAEDYVIIGWSANIGNTLAELEAWYANPTVTGWIGESAISGSIAPSAGGNGLGGTIMGTHAPTINGFTLGEVLVPTPEPATIALAGLGGLSMLLIRRRKS